MKRIILLAVICAVVGLGWWVIESRFGTEGRTLASTDALTHKSSHLTHSRESVLDLDKELLAEELVAPLDEGIKESPPSSIVNFHRARSLRQGMVSQEIIDLLKLSSQEVNRLNELVRSGVDQLRGVELDRVEVVSASEEEVVLRIPAHPEEGREVAEAIHHGVINIIGEDRGMQFMNAMASSIALFWNDFGHFARTVTFSVEPRGSGKYWVEFRQDLPQDQVEAYYGRPISNEVSVWPGFGKLFFADRTNIVGPNFGRARYLLPVLPEGMRSLFELMEEPSEDEYKAYRKRFGLD